MFQYKMEKSNKLVSVMAGMGLIISVVALVLALTKKCDYKQEGYAQDPTNEECVCEYDHEKSPTDPRFSCVGCQTGRPLNNCHKDCHTDCQQCSCNEDNKCNESCAGLSGNECKEDNDCRGRNPFDGCTICPTGCPCGGQRNSQLPFPYSANNKPIFMS